MSQSLISSPTMDESKDYDMKEVLPMEQNELIVEAGGPYGFWKVRFKRGKVPDLLSGNFTSREDALAAVKQYLSMRGDKVGKTQKLKEFREARAERVGGSVRK